MRKDFLKKESEEKKQSGVDVKYGELDQSLQDIKERMAEFDELREGEEQKQKKEKAAAEEMRRQATEKLSETKKRKASLEDPDVVVIYLGVPAHYPNLSPTQKIQHKNPAHYPTQKSNTKSNTKIQHKI